MCAPSALLSVCVVTHPDNASSKPTTRTRSARMQCPLVLTLADIGAAPGAVGHLPRQLPARGIDVVTAGAAQHGKYAGVEQPRLEIMDVVGVRALVLGARKR